MKTLIYNGDSATTKQPWEIHHSTRVEGQRRGGEGRARLLAPPLSFVRRGWAPGVCCSRVGDRSAE